LRPFALRDHGTPFGRRNLDADLLVLRRFLRLQPVLAEPEGGNQAAMDKEVRIAPDGRGEMRVIREMQAEVMQVFGAVDSLRLAAEDQRTDQLAVDLVFRLGQNAVEG